MECFTKFVYQKHIKFENFPKVKLEIIHIFRNMFEKIGLQIKVKIHHKIDFDRYKV